MWITFKHNCTYTGNGFDLETGTVDETKFVPHNAACRLLKIGAAIQAEDTYYQKWLSALNQVSR